MRSLEGSKCKICSYPNNSIQSYAVWLMCILSVTTHLLQTVSCKGDRKSSKAVENSMSTSLGLTNNYRTSFTFKLQCRQYRVSSLTKSSLQTTEFSDVRKKLWIVRPCVKVQLYNSVMMQKGISKFSLPKINVKKEWKLFISQFLWSCNYKLRKQHTLSWIMPLVGNSQNPGNTDLWIITLIWNLNECFVKFWKNLMTTSHHTHDTKSMK